jgi:hypothetical protein
MVLSGHFYISNTANEVDPCHLSSYTRCDVNDDPVIYYSTVHLTAPSLRCSLEFCTQRPTAAFCLRQDFTELEMTWRCGHLSL